LVREKPPLSNGLIEENPKQKLTVIELFDILQKSLHSPS
jgi:hypothetical protein